MPLSALAEAGCTTLASMAADPSGAITSTGFWGAHTTESRPKPKLPTATVMIIAATKTSSRRSPAQALILVRYLLTYLGYQFYHNFQLFINF